MANYVNVDVKCPECYKVIFREHQNTEGSNSVTGTRVCPNCKAKVSYSISGGYADTWIEN